MLESIAGIREIGLRGVTTKNQFGLVAHAGYQHAHLSGREVLGLVTYDVRPIKTSTSEVSDRLEPHLLPCSQIDDSLHSQTALKT